MRTAILLALALIVGSAFALPSSQSEQKATTPPGKSLPLVVDTIKPVEDDPNPVPAADPLEIVAYIGGQEITTEHVELPVGRLLTLKTRGTALKDDQTPAVHWSMNRESLDYSIYPDHGHHLTFTAPEAGTWLLVAAVNNSEPLLPPHVAMRWVVVTGAQPPPAPPAPTPTPTPGPAPAPVVTGLKHGYFILLDSWTQRSQTEDLQSLHPHANIWAGMKAAGHKVANFDIESKVARETYGAYIEQSPVLLVFDADKGNAFVGSQHVGNAEAVRQYYKQLTGSELPK